MEIRDLININSDGLLSETRMRNRSLSRKLLCNELKCDYKDIRWNIFIDYYIKKVSIQDLEIAIQNIQSIKEKHAKKLSFHPDDTPAQIVLKHTIDYLNIIKSKTSTEKSSKNSLEKILLENPEILDIASAGDDIKFKNYMKENPEINEFFNAKPNIPEAPAKKIIDMALDQMYEDNYSKAQALLILGLKHIDDIRAPMYYILSSDCLCEMEYLDDALGDINKAIELLIKDGFDFDEEIASALLSRANIREKKGDLPGAELDRREARFLSKLTELS